MQTIVNILIVISQFTNVIVSSFTKDRSDNDADEMLCSKAWRLQYDPFWGKIKIFFDEYAWPLSVWKGSYKTHCEACFFQEKQRLEDRVKQYKIWGLKNEHLDDN
jgi:hypothetical protein